TNSAELDWKASQAAYDNAKAGLQTQRMTQEAAVATAPTTLQLAVKTYNADKSLGDQGIVGALQVDKDKGAVDQAQSALDVAKKTLQNTLDTQASQLAPAEALVNQKKAAYDQFRRQMDDLNVKSPLTGVLAAVPVDIGAQVGQGTNLVRVVDPTQLKANVRISETTMKDLTINLPAMIDTRNGIVKGHVIRIDPAANGG